MGSSWQDNINNATSVSWNIPLGQCKMFNIANPKFAVSVNGLNLGLSLSTNMMFELCWSFNLTLGFSNEQGCFIDVTGKDEISCVPNCAFVIFGRFILMP